MMLLPLTTWAIKSTLLGLIFTAFRPMIWLRNLAIAGIVVSGMWYVAVSIMFHTLCGPVGGHVCEPKIQYTDLRPKQLRVLNL